MGNPSATIRPFLVSKGTDMKKQSVKRGLVIFGAGIGIWVVTLVVILFSYPFSPSMTEMEMMQVLEGVWFGYKILSGIGMLAALIGFAMTIAGLLTSDSHDR